MTRTNLDPLSLWPNYQVQGQVSSQEMQSECVTSGGAGDTT